MPPPSYKGKVKKLKKRPEQALQNLQSNPYYVAAATQNAQNQLQNIVQDKNELQNQAGLPAYADPTHKFHDRMTDEKGNLIPYNQLDEAQKSIYDFYSSSTANAYQQELQNFITSSPINMAVYKSAFPIGGNFNAFMTTAPEKYFGNTIGGSIIKSFGAAKDGIGTIKEKIYNVFSSDSDNSSQYPLLPKISSSYNYDNLNIEGYPDEVQRDLGLGKSNNQEDTSETNIEAIKDEKNIFKSNKIKNAQDTFAFYNTLNNPSNVLPPNFAETFEKLKDTNQLSSGDFMKANQLLKDIVPVKSYPPMINAQTTGISQVLPPEVQTATNLFSNFQPNITPVVDKVSEYSKMLSDDQGFDIDPLNQGISYSAPFLGGTLTGEISDVGGDNPTAGLFFNKLI